MGRPVNDAHERGLALCDVDGTGTGTGTHRVAAPVPGRHSQSGPFTPDGRAVASAYDAYMMHT